jgi:Mg2+-importing ATPase
VPIRALVPGEVVHLSAGDYAFLNSYFQTGLKNLLDRAVLEHEDLVQTKGLAQRYAKCDEVPFDFARRRMSVVVHEVFRGRDLLLCKGAVEEVVAVCTHARIDGHVVPLTDDLRERALELRTGLNGDGLRVIAVASKVVDSQPDKQYGVADEAGLVLCGYIAFLDPPKETAGPALDALRRHGVAVKILTGDNELVARKVCKDVGLDPARTLLGRTIDAMDDAELEAAAAETTLFAKLTPPQKARVIRALKRKGHTVGFLGDGINDAPALREADVAIPFTPLGTVVGLVPLPGSYFPWLAATLLGYCALTQGVKVWYIRRFGMWL